MKQVKAALAICTLLTAASAFGRNASNGPDEPERSAAASEIVEQAPSCPQQQPAGEAGQPQPSEPDWATETPPVPFGTEVDEPPKFQDGDINTFRYWVQARIVFPRKTCEKVCEGKVVVKFFVERDCYLSDIRVIASPDRDLSEEALRVVSLSPAWTPAKHKGETVKVKYFLPIDFVLHD